MASAVVKTAQEVLQNVEDDSNDALRVNVVAGGAGDGAIQDGSNSAIEATVFDYTSSNPLAVRLTDTNGDYAAAGAGTQYTEDDAAAANPVGNALILVRTDTPSARTSANGDNVVACGTDKGELLVKQTDAVPVTDNGGSLTVDGTVTANLAAGTNNIGDVDILSIAAGDNNIGNVDIVTMPNVTLAAGTNTNEVVGDAAHDAAVAGNPVLVGFEARSTSPTAVGDGDVVRAQATLLGKQVVYPWAIPASSWSYAAASGGIVNTTGVTIKAAGGAGVRIYLTDLHVINGHATVSTDVQIRDGASGTVLWRGFAQAAGGGISIHFSTPLRGTANTLLEVACGTTGSAVYVNATGFVAAE